MNPWAFASAASLFATTLLAVFIIARVPRTPSRLPFMLLTAAFAMWDLGEAIVRFAPAASLAALDPWIRLQWVGIALTSGTFLHFALNFARGRALLGPWWRLPIVYAVSAVVAPLVAGTNVVVSGVAEGPLGPVARVGFAYPAAAVMYEAWFAFTVVVLLRAYLRSRSPEVRRRSRAVVLVLAAAAVSATATEVFWPLYTSAPGNLGLASIYMLAVAIAASASEVRFKFLEIPAVTEPGSARGPSLSPGLAYLFLSRDRDAPFTAFRDLVSRVPGLCLSGVHPSKLQERYGLERTPILWFTSAEGARAVRPRALEFEVLHTVIRFVKENPATVVLVDDIDLLVHTVGFDAVARFLHRLNNLATGRGSTMIAALDPDAILGHQFALLRGLFDEVREVPPPVSFLEPVLPPGPGAVLLEGDPAAAASLYESLASGKRGLLVTTKNPVRLQRQGTDTARVVWIGGPGDAAGDDGPAAIDLEAGRLTTRLLRDVARPILFVPDLEQLPLHAPFPRVLEFVKGLIDQTAIQSGVLLASVVPKGMSPMELASLRRRFDRVREL